MFMFDNFISEEIIKTFTFSHFNDLLGIIFTHLGHNLGVLWLKVEHIVSGKELFLWLNEISVLNFRIDNHEGFDVVQSVVVGCYIFLSL